MNSHLPKGASIFLLWVILLLLGILLIGWMIYHTHGRNALPKNQQQSQITLLSCPPSGMPSSVNITLKPPRLIVVEPRRKE